MRQLSEKTILSRIVKYIETNKYLNDSKYFKTNYWSLAHYESEAVQGHHGGCYTCNVNFYNATLHNKRSSTKPRGRKSWVQDVSVNFCDSCVSLIHKVLDVRYFDIHNCS